MWSSHGSQSVDQNYLWRTKSQRRTSVECDIKLSLENMFQHTKVKYKSIFSEMKNICIYN